MPVFPGLGAELNQLIFDRRTNVKALSEEAGLSRQTLHVILAEDRASRASVEKLEHALGAKLTAAHEGGAQPPDPSVVGGQWEPEPDVPDDGPSAEGIELEDYVASFDRIVRTLRTLPGDRLSIPLKLAILDGVKDNAEAIGATLPREWLEIRKRVLNGDL